MTEQRQAGIATVVLIIIWIAILASVGWGHEVPFEYDPNLCIGPPIDSAMSEPNIAVIYSFALYFPAADSSLIDVNEMSMDVNAPPDVNDFLVQYHGVKPINPIGFYHSWTVSCVPKKEGVFYFNFQVPKYTYELYAGSDAFGFGPEKRNKVVVTGSYYATMLVKCTTGERPYIGPGPSPASIAMAQRHIQYAKKHGQNIGYAQVLP